MSDIQDHFNVLIVCALESELQAVKAVLENGTNGKFENKYTHPRDLNSLNVRVCEGWNSTEMKVGMVAQTDMGGSESQRLLSNLAKYFTATVVVMPGICAGEENVHGQVEHGCVFVAKRTTAEMGGRVEEDGKFQARAQYCELNSGILASINELVHVDSDEWLKYIPERAVRPSPRYLQQLILDFAMESGPNGISKRELLDKMVAKELRGMTTMKKDKTVLTYDEILNTMLKQSSPWVSVSPTSKFRYIATEEGEGYAANEAIFPRENDIIAIVDSMLSVSHKHMNLKAELSDYKTRVADRKVKAVDMEAYYFMNQAKESFKRKEVPGKAVVMKGISDYGSNASKGDYFHGYAASTSAAFLRHLMTVKQHLFVDEESQMRKPQYEPPPRAVPSAHPHGQVQPTNGAQAAAATACEYEALIQDVDGRKKLTKVIKNVSGSYLEIGLEAGLKQNVIDEKANAQVSGHAKLQAVLGAIKENVGEKEMLRIVLKACKELGIMGGIRDDLS